METYLPSIEALEMSDIPAAVGLLLVPVIAGILLGWFHTSRPIFILILVFGFVLGSDFIPERNRNACFALAMAGFCVAGSWKVARTIIRDLRKKGLMAAIRYNQFRDLVKDTIERASEVAPGGELEVCFTKGNACLARYLANIFQRTGWRAELRCVQTCVSVYGDDDVLVLKAPPTECALKSSLTQLRLESPP